MGLEIIRVITTVAGVYQFMLILYGLNIYWHLYLPMFLADLLDACCRPYVSLFKDVRFGKYSLALVTSILTIYVSVGVLAFIVSKIFGVYKMGNGVEQHFRKEELSFLKQVEEWVEEVRLQYAPVLTNYLDPRQQFIVEAIVGQYDDVRYYFDGGYIDAERKRCMICPEYYEPTSEDFENALFHIQYPKKFATLGHGKILGSLMSLGFDRSLIGDIISNGEDWQLFCAQNMKEYIRQQLEKIGKVAVRLEEVDYTKLIVPVDHWTAVQTVVSSLRLDTVIASVFNVSRQRSKEMIESGKVKVNWTEENRPDFMLEILDIVSIRGYGRLQIQKIEGRTKKDKIKVELGLLEKNKK